MVIKEQGSHTTWNNIWSSFNKDSEVDLSCLFTKESPKNLTEFWQKGYADDILSLIKDKKYTKFCELGSGRATTSSYLSDAGYTDITLVDLAESGLKQAQLNFERHHLPAPKTVIADVENTPFEDNSFDCIYNIGLLEHFEDPSKTLKEAYRLLAKDGLIFMPIVPKMPFRKSLFARTLFNPLSILKHIVKKIIGHKSLNPPNDDMIRTDFDKHYYQEIAEKLGFQNVQCLPYNPYPRITSNLNYENQVILNCYKKHYDTKKTNAIKFLTTDAYECCFLLIGTK